MVDEALEAHDPRQTPLPVLPGARLDAGLAWLDFPPGHGGLGASRRWQSFVERRFRDAGAPSPVLTFRQVVVRRLRAHCGIEELLL